MRVSSYLIPAALLLGAVLLAWPSALESQTASTQEDPFAAAALPDAPLPQLARVQAPAGQAQQPAQPPGQSNSGEQTTSGSFSSETEHQKAEEQIKQEEKQRAGRGNRAPIQCFLHKQCGLIKRGSENASGFPFRH
jgi:hypothetical protein